MGHSEGRHALVPAELGPLRTVPAHSGMVQMPVEPVALNDALLEKIMSNMQEVRARGA